MRLLTVNLIVSLVLVLSAFGVEEFGELELGSSADDEVEETPFDDFFALKSKVETGEMEIAELVDLMQLGLELGREGEVAELSEIALGTPQNIRDEDARYEAALDRTIKRKEGEGAESVYRGRKMYDGSEKYKREAKIYNSSGAAYFALGQYGPARDYFEIAVLNDPLYDEPYANLGLLYRIKGKYDAALKQYEKAIELSPANKVTWYNIGIVQMRLGLIEQALDSFAKSAGLDPKFRAPVRRTALIWLDLGDYQEAEKYVLRLEYQMEGAEIEPTEEEWDDLFQLKALVERMTVKVVDEELPEK